MSSLLVVYGDPDPVATIESHRTWDAPSGLLHEFYLWDCECGARGQTATIDDAQAELRHHRAHHGHHEHLGQS